VVASGLEYFGPAGVLTGVERQSSDCGYSIFLKLIRDPVNGDTDRILNELLSHRVEGIIWAVPEIGSNHDWLATKLGELEVPVVFISSAPRSVIANVDIDNAYGAELATRHLIDQGCQHIGLICGPRDWWDARQREEGWRAAMTAASLPVTARQVAEGDWSTLSGERAYEELLEKFPEMDSVFACNDQMALGVLQVIYRQRKRVPRDLALVGFDDIPEAAYFLPPLTTIRQDLIRLGGMAVEALCRMLEARYRRQRIVPETILVKPTLIVRESSLKPRSQ
jgi:DNA-binding LacI/PurR family transcriptional regulator